MPVIDLCSEVAGTVWRLEARLGQSVAEDDVVLTVESMKMEIPLCAPQQGVLVELRVAEADMVQEGAVVARLQVT